jgi:hypothetical protein
VVLTAEQLDQLDLLPDNYYERRGICPQSHGHTDPGYVCLAPAGHDWDQNNDH